MTIFHTVARNKIDKIKNRCQADLNIFQKIERFWLLCPKYQ